MGTRTRKRTKRRSKMAAAPVVDFPYFMVTRVDDDIVDFFVSELERHKQEKYLVKPGDTATIKGDQTHNLLQVLDLETHRYLQRIYRAISRKTKLELEYIWLHMIEYEKTGYQEPHTHEHHEEVSFVIYLNDDRKGHTHFVLNPKRGIEARVKPEAGKMVIFASTVPHQAFPTSRNKKVLVGGLRVAPRRRRMSF